MSKVIRNEIVFSFPHVKRHLLTCADRFIAEWLPRILAENAKAVAERITKESGGKPAAENKQFRVKIARMSPDEIAAKFAEMVRDRCNIQSQISIQFQRTLRLPDDGQDYPLPPGLGDFPLRRVEDFGKRVPRAWKQAGVAIMPMYQAEAMWMNFTGEYPVALKIGTGRINAVNGASWSKGLQREPQGYVVLPEQPWLDGYCVEKGVVRQFIAAPLGKGYTAEEQLEGSTDGGIRLEAVPLNPEMYFDKELVDSLPRSLEDVLEQYDQGQGTEVNDCGPVVYCASPGMGLGAGGRMEQEIYEDQWEASDWDLAEAREAQVRICDALQWADITGELPPTEPVTTETYARYGLPWFDYYRDDMKALEATGRLASLKSVQALADKAVDLNVPDEDSVEAQPVIQLGPQG